jgi:hypothetical protein
MSSSAPGASPTNISCASMLPTPNTTFLRVEARCGHLTQTIARSRSSAMAWALAGSGVEGRETTGGGDATVGVASSMFDVRCSVFSVRSSVAGVGAATCDGRLAPLFSLRARSVSGTDGHKACFPALSTLQGGGRWHREALGKAVTSAREYHARIERTENFASREGLPLNWRP